jgi:hypothetical protein
MNGVEGEALRYVELNPVRAGLVGAAADWPWLSAAVHLGGRDRTGLLDPTEWGATYWTKDSTTPKRWNGLGKPHGPVGYPGAPSS